MGNFSVYSDSDIERFEGVEKASVVFDPSVMHILSLVRTYGSISKADELALLKAHRFNEVVLHNVGFIVKSLKNIIGLGNPYFADIFNECFIALVDKAASFNPSKSNGGRFINYVALELKSVILESVRKFTSHLTKDNFKLANQINKMEQRYLAEYGVCPSSGVLADYMKANGLAKDVDVDKLRDLIADIVEAGKADVSTASSVDGGDDDCDATVGDFLSSGDSTDTLLTNNLKSDQLDWVLNHYLTKRQKEILLAHFGYKRHFPVSTEDLALEYGFTTTYINQIIAAAVAILVKNGVYDTLVQNFDFN